MKTRVFGLISTSFVLASIGACSSSSSNGNSAADACTSYGNAYIAHTQKCSTQLDPTQTSTLTARYVKLCQSELSLPGLSPNVASQLSACAATIAATDCSTDIGDACTIDTNGTLADGAPCSDGLECSSGSCDDKSGSAGGDAGTSSSDPNCGKCAPAVADGGDCSSGTCVKGDTCTYASGTDGSFTAKCTPKTTGADVGASCTQSSECKSPNHCNVSFTNGAESGTCAAPVAEGGSCGDSSECASGLVCGGSDETRTCGKPVAEGAACTGNDCQTGLACDSTTQKCAKVTYGAVGASCNGTTLLCSNGQCNTSESGTPTGTCPTIIADNGTCDESNRAAQCDVFASCDNGKCTLGVVVCK